MSAIEVVLVDDQALFRAGIRMLVDSQPDLAVVGEASDGREAIDVVRAAKPDVVLMDIRMPVFDGLAATAELLRDPDPPRIVMLTTFDLDEAAARAIRQGASGFLLKDADPEFLLAAIRTVHSGSAVIAASATRDLFAHSADAATRAVPPEYGRLTDREREIFALAAPGLERRDRCGRVAFQGNRQDAHQPHPHQAQPARPRTARRLRVRARTHLTLRGCLCRPTRHRRPALGGTLPPEIACPGHPWAVEGRSGGRVERDR
jgi:DNA-binding NarL/FixJ family response regulator